MEIVGAVDGAGTVTTDRYATFDDFYAEQYRPSLKLAALLLRDLDDAAEVVQEVFTDAYRRWSKVRAYDRPDLWVRRAAINRAISRYRKRRSEATALERVHRRAVERPTPVDEPGAGAWEIVRSLPRRQAEALALVYGLDLSVEDTAAAMGCSSGAVKMHLSRGRAALAERLQEVTDA